jgi:hypothetical protein
VARPISLWGDPDSQTFVRDYLTTVTFMGKRLTWHKWAVIPLMAVQADITASGVHYDWSDLQTYCNRYIAGTHVKSNHSWALAIDINPAKNPWQKPLKTDIPVVVREAFARHGFNWGGNYSTPDTMHMEYLGEPVKEDDMTPDEVRAIVAEEIDIIYSKDVAVAQTHLVRLGVLSKDRTADRAASVGFVCLLLSRVLKLLGKS